MIPKTYKHPKLGWIANLYTGSVLHPEKGDVRYEVMSDMGMLYVPHEDGFNGYVLEVTDLLALGFEVVGEQKRIIRKDGNEIPANTVMENDGKGDIIREEQEKGSDDWIDKMMDYISYEKENGVYFTDTERPKLREAIEKYMPQGASKVDENNNSIIDKAISIIEVDHLLGMNTKRHPGIARVLDILRELKRREMPTATVKGYNDSDGGDKSLRYKMLIPCPVCKHEFWHKLPKVESIDDWSKVRNPIAQVLFDYKDGKTLSGNALDRIEDILNSLPHTTLSTPLKPLDTRSILQEMVSRGVLFENESDQRKFEFILSEYAAPIDRDSVIDECVEAIKKKIDKYGECSNRYAGCALSIEALEQLKKPLSTQDTKICE